MFLRFGSFALWLVIWVAGQKAAAQYQATAQAKKAEHDVVLDDNDVSRASIEIGKQPFALPTIKPLLLSVPGSRLTSSGGPEAFAGLRLRGAEPEQTQVFLGDVPLGAQEGAFDISTLPPWLFDRIDVFRGATPLWLGASPIGGVLRLIPRAAAQPGFMLRGGAGSFGLRTFDAATTGYSAGGPEWTVAAGYLQSDGDYRYKYDQGTTLNANDDKLIRRQNADVRDVYALSRMRAANRHQRLEMVFFGFTRDGGIFNPQLAGDNQARRTSARFQLTLQHEWHAAQEGRADARWRWQNTLSVALEEAHVLDAFAQVRTVPLDSHDMTLSARGRSAMTRRINAWWNVQALGQIDHAAFKPSDRLSAMADSDSARTGYVLGVENEWHKVLGTARWSLRATGRLEGLHADLKDIRQENLGAASTLSQVLATWRLSVGVEPTRVDRLSLSVYRGARFPSLREFFGDRGFVVGNTSLRPETSTTLELGEHRSENFKNVTYELDARAFVQRVDDLIRYERVAPYVIRPDNVDQAKIYGAELSAQALFVRWIKLASALTWLDAKDAQGRTLPFRPPLRLYGRGGLVFYNAFKFFDLIETYADSDYLSTNVVDSANQVRLPARVQVGAGLSASFYQRRATLALSVYNMLNAYQYDLIGFPLPTRAINMSFTWNGAL